MIHLSRSSSSLLSGLLLPVTKATLCNESLPRTVIGHLLFITVELSLSSLFIVSHLSLTASYSSFHSLPATPPVTHCQLLLLSLTVSYSSCHSLPTTPPFTHCQLLLLSLAANYYSISLTAINSSFYSLPATPFTHCQVILLSLTVSYSSFHSLPTTPLTVTESLFNHPQAVIPVALLLQ